MDPTILTLPTVTKKPQYIGEEADKSDLEYTNKRKKPNQEVIFPIASPGVLTFFYQAEYTDDPAEFLHDLIEPVSQEAQVVVENGGIASFDCPDLLFGWQMLPWKNKENFQHYVESHIEALNQAIGDLPPQKLRLHACYGNYAGHHRTDIPLEDVLPLLYQAKVGTLVLEMALPSHRADFLAFKDHPLPKDKKMAAGIIEPRYPVIESPRVVANHLTQIADIVGPEKTQVTSGCGYGTFAHGPNLSRQTIQWKIDAMVKGAELASQHYQ
jgi:5-methyltetrahydropteroyltriglutamate--homocysteine methyltransferase